MWYRPWQRLQAAVPWTAAAKAASLRESVVTLWQRHSSDDLLYLFLVLIDAFVTKARYVLTMLGSF